MSASATGETKLSALLETQLWFGLAALSGALQVAVFPRFSLYWLAPFAVAPLLIAFAKADGARRPARTRFLLGWLAGSIYWGGTCYWVFGVMNDYAGMPAAAAVAVYLAFLVVKGLHLGLFGLLAGPLLRRPWAMPALAALWVAVEGSHQYLGFTWLHLGSAATTMSLIAPLAPYTGVYGLSFALMLFNVAVALVALRRPRRELFWIAAVPLLFLLPDLPDGETGDVPVRLLQPNVHPDQLIAGNWTAERHQQHLARMVELSTIEAERLDPAKPELVIWPEYSVPAYFFDRAATRDFFIGAARHFNAHFIFNTVAFKDLPEGRRPLNTAVTLGPDGSLVSRYSKMYLVPFGEFVPWPFSLIIDKVTLEAGDFYPGDEAAVAQIGDHKVGTYICYENVFARGVRRFTLGGAEALVNISNDSWYGPTAARYQHLLIARMRAIENQRYILRATADGITTVINRAGQITPPLPSFEQGVLCARFAYHDEITWFVRFGEWFWYLCCIAAAGLLVAAARKS